MYNTQTTHDLAQVKFHWTIMLSGAVIFVLIYKSVENDMGQMSLFVERSGSAVCLIL